MARAKRTPRASAPVAPQSVTYVGVNEPIPSRLISYVLSSPIEEQQAGAVSHGELPPKRRKLNAAESPSSFCVASEVISISRPLEQHLPADRAYRRVNVGTRSLELSDLELSLTLDSIRFHLQLLPEETSSRVDDVLRITREPRNDTPGAVWSSADIMLARKKKELTIEVRFQLFWNETPSSLSGFRRSDHRKVTDALIDTFYPNPAPLAAAWSPMDFYEAACVPSRDDRASDSIEIPGLDATLFPYQKRTLQWLLKREGVHWSDRRRVERSAEGMQAPVSDSARIVFDVDGRKLLLNDIFHTVSTSSTAFSEAEQALRGGILAEEMGLGKTLEILALILLHDWATSDIPREPGSSAGYIASGATLIVAPEALRRQWLSEIARHAPSLRAEFYQGCKRGDGAGEDTAKRLAGCDVVVTTYSILSSELHFAQEPPERARRHERKYERPKSPLVKIMWWRLCLDEAQMVENGLSQAATVARTIPRVNAWGITGTPVKDDVKDLYGLLVFLRYEPLCYAPQLWQALTRDRKSVFQRLFNTISLRHTKALVRDEIALPPQRRFAISVPFTAVEEQHYQSLYKEMTVACGVDMQGNPTVVNWTPDHYEESMRIWLNRLRQTALHPEVGAYSRRILGQNRSRPMRTVEEVLDAMLEHSDSSIRADQRALLASKLTRGQLYENSPRARQALAIWEEVREEANQMVADAHAELSAASGRDQVSRSVTESEGFGDNARDNSEDPEGSDDELDHAEPKGRLGEIRRKLRSALETQHKAVFFCANALFQIRDNKDMTTPDSDEFHGLKKIEDEGYEEAKKIRREILREPHRKASRLMAKIAHQASGQSFTEVSELSVRSEKGIESGRIIDELEMLYRELNDQANVIDEWREQSAQLLLKTLLDEDEEVETTGEEMGDAAKAQDEMIIYVQALRAAIADRQDAMTGQTNELVNYEAQTSLRMARDGDGPMPERMRELLQIRSEIKPQIAHISMRGAISELRSLVTRLRNEPNQTERVRVEQSIALKHLKDTQAALNEQSKAASSLESEIESFRTTMNARLEYYRQLQSVSDSVLPYDGPRTEDAAARMARIEEELEQKLASAEAKHRYLLHLKEAGLRTNEPRMCVICQMPFETGVLTVCGHQFCKECMMVWYRAHRNCPICKKHLSPSQLHDITMKPQELRLHGEGSSNQADADGRSPRDGQDGTRKTMIYSTFNSEKLAEIKNIELDGPSYTTKVDTLVRHLLWLRQTDPGAKSIVFSQYKDFLGVLTTAFRRFRIGFASIDTHGGTTRFKEDPSVEVFLLHARAHSSGLNLVSANNVFLCEPLVNTALELQAIARVDRIGQQHETTVWLYITSGTVEESIYNLSVKRRLEHMGRNTKGKSKESTPELLDANLEAANTLEMEHAALTKLMSKDRTAGEVVDKGDLWECLFGHNVKEAAAGPARDFVDLADS